MWSGTSGAPTAPKLEVSSNVYIPECQSDSQDGIVFLQNLDVIIGDVAPGLLVSIRRPIKLGKVDLEASDLFGSGMNDPDTGLDDFGSDTVSSDLSDLVLALCLGLESVSLCTYRSDQER